VRLSIKPFADNNITLRQIFTATSKYDCVESGEIIWG